MTSATSSLDSFGARSSLTVGDRTFEIFRIDALADRFDVSRLPFSLKVVLENLLRHEDNRHVRAEDVEAVAGWAQRQLGGDTSQPEIALTPERVLMQDFTGVPAVVDLAAMRDAITLIGGDPAKVNPLVPVELVIDHSVIVESSGRADSLSINVQIEYERNIERYQLLRWAQQAFDGFKVVPPGTGICHQVNLEFLSRVVFATTDGQAFPDTLVGTDSHTTMVNGLGVLGWGVGGIEAEAAMLGQPLTMLVPPVVGLRLHGRLPEGATATDLVLTICERLRQHGVVGKFVEAFGPGITELPLENRATIGNMSPEYGATCTVFPIDQTTLDYLRFTARDEDHVALVEAYAKAQGLWHDPDAPEPVFSETVEVDLTTIVPSLAGPARPQDRVDLSGARAGFRRALSKTSPEIRRSTAEIGGARVTVADGDVVIAAITSCTNTSNPQVMMAAGLVAKKATSLGLTAKPHVKASLAPGSRVVVDYYEQAGLLDSLAAVGFDVVGFGCTTCIGNSGPLLPGVSEAVQGGDLSVSAVLSGNRNFEGRIHPDIRLNYLASPPLVVAYALAGTMDIDLATDPLGTSVDGKPVYLADLWPTQAEVTESIRQGITTEMFAERYGSVYDGDESWQAIEVVAGNTFDWDDDSTYVLRPPFFEDFAKEPAPVAAIAGARVLAMLGDSVTTDHISPAGSIRPDVPAASYLVDHEVRRADFNSYGARRGNHEVMMRGTFANIRLRNQLAPGTEGGITIHLPSGDQTSIFEASERYRREGTPLVILAGKEYGSGSSRDWAAKGPALLGVRAVIAESYERIHRSNLVGMGILPLQYPDGQSAAGLGLSGDEVFEFGDLALDSGGAIPKEIVVKAGDIEFTALVRIDTPMEVEYFRHGGILQYVLRQLAAQ